MPVFCAINIVIGAFKPNGTDLISTSSEAIGWRTLGVDDMPWCGKMLWLFWNPTGDVHTLVYLSM